MKPVRLAVAACLLAATISPAMADGYPAIPLYSGNTTVVGEEIAYPPGKANVNAMIVTLAPGEKTVLHQHGVPTFIYILDGEVTVDYGGDGKKAYKQGDSFLEAMQVAHVGMNLGSVPVRILAVYIGADGAKDVVPVK